MTDQQPSFLFCVGAQKAGTTWLYDYFDSHPQVHVPPVKEMHYFNVLWDPAQAGFRRNRESHLAEMGETRMPEWLSARIIKFKQAMGKQLPGDHASPAVLRQLVSMYDSSANNHEGYRRLMLRGAARQKWAADITPDYSTLGARGFQRMLDEFPDAKFIFLMRDPVQRTWSHLKMYTNFYRTNIDPDVTVDEILRRVLAGRQKHILQRSNYTATLFALGRLPQDRVKYVFYENMFQDDGARDLCAFLDIDFHPGKYGKRIRGGDEGGMTDEQRATLRWLTAPVYRSIYAKFGPEVPKSWDMGAMHALIPDHVDASAVHSSVLNKAGWSMSRNDQADDDDTSDDLDEPAMLGAAE